MAKIKEFQYLGMRSDVLTISFEFEESEITSTYLAKIEYAIKEPGYPSKLAWKPLESEVAVNAVEASVSIRVKTNLSHTSTRLDGVFFQCKLLKVEHSLMSGKFDL